MTLLLTLFVGWAVIAAAMAMVWQYQRSSGRADWVDVAWSLGTGGLAAACALAADGDPARRVLIASLAGAWAARLAWHLAARIRRSEEDRRYAALRREHGESANTWLFWFFQAQALLCVLLAIPALIAARNPSPLGWLDLAGVLVWLSAVAGEAVADGQLDRFRRSRPGPSAVCRDGLWGYSRHPNYFFEWVHWWTYVCIGWGAPLGWLTLIGPAAMLLLLCRVTGIPPVEAEALARRGDAYRDYQRTVSAFFPWPPKQVNQ